ncbi:hypothetical protein EVAR_83093_1 [Eumeta japonica]|uniref:Uncharacterized protein n=1 Tax=Eumeta variegata TaxID=151549 RepID=A0A4C1WMI1_EUMVA|nr:hypothetical protein EVAR_83093_1 [Eumeta japonica]
MTSRSILKGYCCAQRQNSIRRPPEQSGHPKREPIQQKLHGHLKKIQWEGAPWTVLKQEIELEVFRGPPAGGAPTFNDLAGMLEFLRTAQPDCKEERKCTSKVLEKV